MIQINGKHYTHAYTHGGKFHADDVACAALLRLLDKDILIDRGFTPPGYDPLCLIFDIGYGEFDHHSAPREVRPNGVAYAAFGKLWRATKGQFNLTELQQQQFETGIVQPIDFADNTGRMNPLSELLTSMNPTWLEQTDEASNRQFFIAVGVMKFLLEFWIKKAMDSQVADEAAATAVMTGKQGVAVSDCYVPSQAFPDGIYFAVCPSQRGGWQALALRQSDGTQMLFPTTWRGAKDLPDGVTFCHAGGFIAAFPEKEKAIEECVKIVSRELSTTKVSM